MFGYIPPPEEDEKKEEKPKPIELMFACIERSRGYAFCGRSTSEGEFAFTSYRHAVAHYDPRAPKTPTPRLRACIACYDAAKEKIAKEDVWRLG